MCPIGAAPSPPPSNSTGGGVQVDGRFLYLRAPGDTPSPAHGRIGTRKILYSRLASERAKDTLALLAKGALRPGSSERLSFFFEEIFFHQKQTRSSAGGRFFKSKDKKEKIKQNASW